MNVPRFSMINDIDFILLMHSIKIQIYQTYIAFVLWITQNLSLYKIAPLVYLFLMIKTSKRRENIDSIFSRNIVSSLRLKVISRAWSEPNDILEHLINPWGRNLTILKQKERNFSANFELYAANLIICARARFAREFILSPILLYFYYSYCSTINFNGSVFITVLMTGLISDISLINNHMIFN